MKSPEALAKRLASQWENADLREARLLGEPDAWPLTLSIGKPPPAAVRNEIGKVRSHFDAWRRVRIGEVSWQEASYRSTAETVQYPAQWTIPNADAWIAASRDKSVSLQFETLSRLLGIADPRFHRELIRRRSPWLNRDLKDVEQTLRIAAQLEPGCADGLPLRSLPVAGNDTKFFERNESLLLALLDLRFDGEASRQGLEPFLGAFSERGHWLLVLDLEGSFLPFSSCRLRAQDLRRQALPGSHLLIVENETCQHQLPTMPGTIAVLGSGFDLSWAEGKWLREKHVGYWGDIDTWGLVLLARARKSLPHLTPLLMNRETFDAHLSKAVPEPSPANESPPLPLSQQEKELYQHIRHLPQGRLEQEFVSKSLVHSTLTQWKVSSLKR